MKIKLILKIYDALVSGGHISRNEFCREHSITERTFYRYMKEISEFLQRFKRDCAVDIDEQGAYFMKKY